MEPTYTQRGQHGRVVHALGMRIMAGEWAAGDVLPTEEALVNELGVGRSALREAVKVLAGKGLLESRTRAGTRVRPREYWSLMDPDVLGWQFERHPPMKSLDDLAGLRLVLEPAAARLAAEHADLGALAKIEAALIQMRETVDDPEAFIAADLGFHASIFAASGNELLAHLNTMMSVALAGHRHVHTRDRDRYTATLGNHERVQGAIGEHDSDLAEKAMKTLVEGARTDILTYTGRDSDDEN